MKTNPHDQLVIAACIDDARMRVDQFLVARLPHYSRSLIGKFIKAGAITTSEGHPVKASQLVAGHETFIFAVPHKEASSMRAENIPLDIIFTDDHIAVINKPAGLVIHPGAGVPDGTLCNALLYHFPGMAINNVERPGIVHRLDKDTSGIMVIAKTESAHRFLSEEFKERRVEKLYRAFCHGSISATTFDLKTGHVRHPQNRLRFFTKISLEQCHRREIRLAHTSFKVLKTSFGISQLQATLHTGRTHQIRAHLADIDHPILGDEIYGGKRALSPRMPVELRNAITELEGQALHAETLSFTHPHTKERLAFSAPLPDYLARIERNLP